MKKEEDFQSALAKLHRIMDDLDKKRDNIYKTILSSSKESIIDLASKEKKAERRGK